MNKQDKNVKLDKVHLSVNSDIYQWLRIEAAKQGKTVGVFFNSVLSNKRIQRAISKLIQGGT